MSDTEAKRAAEKAARHSYGKLVSAVARRTRDIAAAEDALSEAFASALRTWPVKGVPERPEAWLIASARRVAGHGERHARVRLTAKAQIELIHEELMAATEADFPDERLGLMFACAHPAIDQAMRAPLILQTVLGIEAARIAHAFVVPPATMAQRLVRAKTRIRDSGIAFELPDPQALGDRSAAVLSAIYAAYTLGGDSVAGSDAQSRDLTEEALYLGRLVAGLMPREPEAGALLALMLYGAARGPARRSATGDYVPFAAQDVTLWRRDMIVEAEALLMQATRIGHFGRFQTEAAIQSLHVQGAVTGRPNGDALLALYDVLVSQASSLGGLVARAAAYGAWRGAACGLALLDELPLERAGAYQPYWAARFHLLADLGHTAEALEAERRAIALTSEPAVAAWLSKKAAALVDGVPTSDVSSG